MVEEGRMHSKGYMYVLVKAEREETRRRTRKRIRKRDWEAGEAKFRQWVQSITDDQRAA